MTARRTCEELGVCNAEVDGDRRPGCDCSYETAEAWVARHPFAPGAIEGYRRPVGTWSAVLRFTAVIVAALACASALATFVLVVAHG